MLDILVGALFQYLVATSSSLKVISPLGSQTVLARHEFSLERRYEEPLVNHVFKENILLTMAYIRGITQTGEAVHWPEVDKPFVWRFTIDPGQTISYHSVLSSDYRNAKPLTTVHFASNEGFLSDGYIVGDGTCHLASLIRWVAKDAGLTVTAPTNHDFAPIPEVPKEEGVSIYSNPFNRSRSEPQNLYIQNNSEQPVEFVFTYDGEVLGISAQAARTM